MYACRRRLSVRLLPLSYGHPGVQCTNVRSHAGTSTTDLYSYPRNIHICDLKGPSTPLLFSMRSLFVVHTSVVYVSPRGHCIHGRPSIATFVPKKRGNHASYEGGFCACITGNFTNTTKLSTEESSQGVANGHQVHCTANV
ncbi:hypothetical protein EDD16DRAFT_739167 [Pisolithus croceorrhizus]|nr:hypothetical protein EDD16DRAFT_739167 [Pisolithus croceorrhizus]KAI6095960.1 hypothetical protein EV401DRAFT_1158577 [Pisolithus croceorrhizus]